MVDVLNKLWMVDVLNKLWMVDISSEISTYMHAYSLFTSKLIIIVFGQKW